VLFSDKVLIGGIPTPLKNMKVSWDSSQDMESHKSHVPNHQPEFLVSDVPGPIRTCAKLVGGDMIQNDP